MKKSPVSFDGVRTIKVRTSKPVMIGGLAIGGLLIGAVMMSMLSRNDSGERVNDVDPAYERLANEFANAVVGILSPYRSVVGKIAADADVARALTDGAGGELAALAAQHAPDLAGVLALRILPPDTRDPEIDATPPLSFASISMLRKARNEGKDQPAEVHLAGNEQEHLVILKRIEAESTASDAPDLIGFAHLSISPNVIRRVLNDAPPMDAYAEIRQGRL